MSRVKYDGRSAEIILVGKDGELILQQRDDRPDITNPGMITSFGGSVDGNESVLDAAVRELGEETNLQIDKSRFIFYGEYFKTKEVHGEDWKVTYFVIRDVDYSDMEVYEGQGYVVVRSMEELNKMKPSVLFRKVAEDWFSGWRDFLFMPEPNQEVIDEVKSKYIASIDTSSIKLYEKPLLFCSVGRVSAGKSTIMRQIAGSFDCVEVSKDDLREMLYDKGFNFRNVVSRLFGEVVQHFSDERYNIYIDTNSGTDWKFTQHFVRLGYQPIVFHIEATEDFVHRNVKNKQLRSFFKNSNHVLNSYYANVENYIGTESVYFEHFTPLKTINPEEFNEQMLNSIVDKVKQEFVK